MTRSHRIASVVHSLTHSERPLSHSTFTASPYPTNPPSNTFIFTHPHSLTHSLTHNVGRPVLSLTHSLSLTHCHSLTRSKRCGVEALRRWRCLRSFVVPSSSLRCPSFPSLALLRCPFVPSFLWSFVPSFLWSFGRFAAASCRRVAVRWLDGIVRSIRALRCRGRCQKKAPPHSSGGCSQLCCSAPCITQNAEYLFSASPQFFSIVLAVVVALVVWEHDWHTSTQVCSVAGCSGSGAGAGSNTTAGGRSCRR